MKIFADENMPLVSELFGERSELVRGPGRGLGKKDLAGVDVLLVRSVTRVNAELLEGTAVKFVGSATAGTDHVDQEYLKGAGIEFAYGPGCNANSVAEYVAAALLRLAVRDGFELAGKRVGIVGHGEVGSRVAAKCRALGMETLINDPPLKDAGIELDFVELADLQGVDILTQHVPLTFAGKYPTLNLVNRDWLRRIGKRGMMVLNTCRGGVVDEGALWEAKGKGLVGQVVLDVYEAEKSVERVSDAALKRADIATPHIAGYSYDGKVAGTLMLYEALAKRYGWPGMPRIDELDTQPKELDGPEVGAGYLEQLNWAVQQAYGIRSDHEKLQQAISREGPDRGAYFDGLRKNYPIRREFRNYRVSVERGYSPEAVVTLKELGFGG
ncbi:MAG: 4-phosphoerythronate dehydrogenase [Phycisphaerae bacterium]|nr:4-phosphoerythronate dehydrogenase [Phycisphaerae bacterium]